MHKKITTEEIKIVEWGLDKYHTNDKLTKQETFNKINNCRYFKVDDIKPSQNEFNLFLLDVISNCDEVIENNVINYYYKDDSTFFNYGTFHKRLLFRFKTINDVNYFYFSVVNVLPQFVAKYNISENKIIELMCDVIKSKFNIENVIIKSVLWCDWPDELKCDLEYFFTLKKYDR